MPILPGDRAGSGRLRRGLRGRIPLHDLLVRRLPHGAGRWGTADPDAIPPSRDPRRRGQPGLYKSTPEATPGPVTIGGRSDRVGGEAIEEMGHSSISGSSSPMAVEHAEVMGGDGGASESGTGSLPSMQGGRTTRGARSRQGDERPDAGRGSAEFRPSRKPSVHLVLAGNPTPRFESFVGGSSATGTRWLTILGPLPPQEVPDFLLPSTSSRCRRGPTPSGSSSWKPGPMPSPSSPPPPVGSSKWSGMNRMGSSCLSVTSPVSPRRSTRSSPTRRWQGAFGTAGRDLVTRGYTWDERFATLFRRVHEVINGANKTHFGAPFISLKPPSPARNTPQGPTNHHWLPVSRGGCPMRIAWFTPRHYPCIGGSENYVRAMVRRFVAAGHEVDVLTSDAHDLWYFTDRRRRRVRRAERVVGRRGAGPAVRGPAPAVAALRRSASEPRPALADAVPVGVVHANSPRDRASPRRLRLGLRSRVPVHGFLLRRLADRARARGAADPDAVPAPGHPRRPGAKHYTRPHQVRLLAESDAVVVQTELEAEAVEDWGIPGQDPEARHGRRSRRRHGRGRRRVPRRDAASPTTAR